MRPGENNLVVDKTKSKKEQLGQWMAPWNGVIEGINDEGDEELAVGLTEV